MASNDILMRRATAASVAVASMLIVIKFGAWAASDSLSLLATLIDSVLDALASLVNLVAVRQALQPADREHRFGHGKAEPLAAMGQSAFIAGSAVFLVFEAGQRLLNPVLPGNSELGFVVMGVSIALTLLLVGYQLHVVRQTRSLAISADSLHYKGDLLVNVAVIVAIFLGQRFGYLWADPLFALAIAAYILWTAWRIARQALDMLMDRETDSGSRRRIIALIEKHPEVTAWHDLRTRMAGPQLFVQCHIEMDGRISLYRAHAVSDEVEDSIRAEFPEAEVILHQDPHGIGEEPPRR